MLLDRQITSLLSLFTRTTRASGSFGKEKQKRAAFINVFLSLVFCFVFCALYSNRHRHYKYKREFVLGKNPRFSVSRYALCSLVLVQYIGSLSFSAYVYVSKERELLLFSFHRFQSLSYSLCASVGVLFLFKVWSRRIKRENWRQRQEEEQRQ